MQFLNKLPFCGLLLLRYVGIRRLSSQLFVGGLCYDTNEMILKKAFEEHGEVIEVKVICHRVDGRSKGYGFVKYANQTAADKAIKEMDGKLLEGRNIHVCQARGGRETQRSLLPYSQPTNGSSTESANVTQDSNPDSKN